MCRQLTQTCDLELSYLPFKIPVRVTNSSYVSKDSQQVLRKIECSPVNSLLSVLRPSWRWEEQSIFMGLFLQLSDPSFHPRNEISISPQQHLSTLIIEMVGEETWLETKLKVQPSG